MMDYAQPQAHTYGQHPHAPHMQAIYFNKPAAETQWCFYTNYQFSFGIVFDGVAHVTKRR